MTRRRALFLDRDGTLVYPLHYPSHPEQMRLYEGIEPELRQLQGMGYCLVVITNQAGVAKGYLTEDNLHDMHEYIKEQLSLEGVRLDGVYYCPHHPEGVIPELTMQCTCRKPQPGLLLQAAADLNIDLEGSWFVGDILDDVEAGNRAGCHTVLVDLGTEALPTSVVRCPSFVAPDTCRALKIINTVSRMESELNILYRPLSWRRGQDNA